MQLLLDIGNTRIKWVTHHADRLSDMRAHALHDDWPSALLADLSAPPAAIHVSNVAGPVVADRVRDLATQWHCPVHFHVASDHATLHGHVLRNAYAEPGKLGVDRWLALLAAFDAHHTSLVVAAGTAMTLDAINATGQHLGGLIVPGPTLMQHSLLKHTSDIANRAAQGAISNHYLADNTLGCITQGSLRACASLIHDTHAQLQRDAAVKLWLTGGAAPALLPLLTLPHHHVPDLVLQGLALQATC